MACLALLVSVLVGDQAIEPFDARIDEQVCGLNSLALGASYVSEGRINDIQSFLDVSRAPFSLTDLDQAARKAGLRTVIFHWNENRAARFDCPAVLHVRASESSANCDHFITCFGQRGDFLCVADFPQPPRLVSRDLVFRFWDGDALYLEVDPKTWALA